MLIRQSAKNINAGLSHHIQTWRKIAQVVEYIYQTWRKIAQVVEYIYIQPLELFFSMFGYDVTYPIYVYNPIYGYDVTYHWI